MEDFKSTFQQYIEDVKNSRREHASFFDAPRKYRATKELSIGMHLFQYLEGQEGDRYFDDFDNAEDPPDISAISSDGQKIGVEITELVSNEAIQAQIRGDRAAQVADMVKWPNERIIESIQERIDSKNDVSPDIKAKYQRFILLLHTDEFSLTYTNVEQAINGKVWGNTENLDEGYLLFSYDPFTKSYPVLKLF